VAKVITGVFPEKTDGRSEENDKLIPSYILHISLMFSDPLIWRRVQVPGNISLATLHHVIQFSIGWSDSHYHQFLVGKISYDPTLGSSTIKENTKYDERNFKLYNLEEGMRFMFSYIYDAEGGWEHDIQLEEVVPYSKEFQHPVILSGEQACPPETVTDIHEYQDILASLENSSQNGRAELFELTGNSDFDPDYFDLDAARSRLKLLND